MRIFNKFRGTKGFVSTYERLLRFRYMITPLTEERVRILSFWEKHGLIATKEAFKISRRTLFRWQVLLKEGKGQLKSLTPKSTAPHTKRKRMIAQGIEEALIRFRTEHPRIGKDKLLPLLSNEGYTLSVSTIGRILSDLKQAGRLPDPKKFSISGTTGNLLEQKPRKRKRKLRRPRGYRVLEVDTVVRFIAGMKRYVVTGIDTQTRTAFAACYTNHGSRSASDFLKRVRQVLPDCPTSVQTDNGSEFALHFEQACEELDFTHFHTYPRSPKMNAHIERFNRTLDEEFLRFKKALMIDDVPKFNEALIDWLLWYNGERPHFALGQVAPFKAMMQRVNPEECHMWWTHTWD